MVENSLNIGKESVKEDKCLPQWLLAPALSEAGTTAAAETPWDSHAGAPGCYQRGSSNGQGRGAGRVPRGGGFLGIVSLGFVDHGGPEGKRASTESLG